MPWYESPTQTQKEFARRLLRQWLISVPFALGLPLLPVCIEALHAGSHGRTERFPIVLLWVLLPFEGALFGLGVWNWRCPACHGFLGMSAFPRMCARCGAELCREESATASNPFWTLLHLSLKALRVAHEALHGFVFMIFGACLGALAGVRLAVHVAPEVETALMIGGAAFGLIAGGLIALSALRPRQAPYGLDSPGLAAGAESAGAAPSPGERS